MSALDYSPSSLDSFFLSNYAYQNWLFGAPASVKATAFFGLSLLLAGAGLLFEKKKQNLKLYGRALTAGGLATGYYTIYASHFTQSLYCIPSPILAGALLTLWAGIILGYAVWKRSQIVGILAIGLAFYGILVNPADWLSLFSALTLSLCGMLLFIRYQWISVGLTTVVSAYLSHAFWLGIYPQDVSALLHHGYLLCYWSTFTIALVCYSKRTPGSRKSSYLTALNNGRALASHVLQHP